jgi:hypothetical protein
VSACLSVKEENILTLKLKLTLFFLGCEGEKYPHTHTQTHAVFLSVNEENILTHKLKLTLFF